MYRPSEPGVGCENEAYIQRTAIPFNFRHKPSTNTCSLALSSKLTLQNLLRMTGLPAECSDEEGCINTIEKQEATTLAAAKIRAEVKPPRGLSARLEEALRSVRMLRIRGDRIVHRPISSAKAGGNATVEHASLRPEESFWPSMDRGVDVAVKKLRVGDNTDHDRVVAALIREVSLLKSLNDDHIVKILGFVEAVESGIVWLIFGWERNGNLREFIRSRNWQLPARMSLIDDISRGLAYLHQRKPPICHGDLKSLNILVNNQNRAVITDFGSACPMDPRSPDQSKAKSIRGLSLTGDPGPRSLNVELTPCEPSISVTGPAWTIRWAAPELLEGGLPNLASDIWAFGWICWEALTGNYPFEEGNDNDVAIVLRILGGDIPAIREISESKTVSKVLCNLMMGCWSFDPNERPDAVKCQESTLWMDWSIPTHWKLYEYHTSQEQEPMQISKQQSPEKPVVPP